MEWKSVKKDGYPKHKHIVMATVKQSDGTRLVMSGVRYVADLVAEGYNDDYVAHHPNGVWEGAYEAGADYWEDVTDEVIAWAEYPAPYFGD